MTMRKRVLTVGAALCACVGVSAVSLAYDGTLYYSTYLPAEHALVKQAVEPYYAAVRDATGGSLNFEIAPGGALASAKETLSAMRDGIVDAGYVVDAYSPADVPESTMLTDLAMVSGNNMVTSAAMTETVLLDCEDCYKTYADDNIYPIGFSATSGYLLLCKEPVTNLAAFSGKKIRGTSAWGIWIATAGGTPVNVPSNEIYEGLQRGNLDCTVGPAAHLQNYSLWDVVENVTELQTGTFSGALLIDVRLDVWDELTNEERKALIDNAAEAIANATFAYMNTDDLAKETAIEKGINWLQPEDDLVNRFQEFKKSEVDRVSELYKERGQVKDPDSIIAIYLDNIAKWEGIVEKIGRDKAAYQQALQDEIYSKVKY